MILHINTKVDYIDSNGIVFIKLGNFFSFQVDYINVPVLGQELDIWLYMILKEVENKMDLKFYGFDDLNMINHFDNLMSISGVGPRMAFNLLKSIKIDELKEIIRKGEYDKIKKIPGIGDKLAKRIVLELSRLYSNDDSILTKINTQSLSSDQNEVISSLTQMGFDKNLIIETIQLLGSDLTKKELLQKVLLKISKNDR